MVINLLSYLCLQDRYFVDMIVCHSLSCSNYLKVYTFISLEFTYSFNDVLYISFICPIYSKKNFVISFTIILVF